MLMIHKSMVGRREAFALQVKGTSNVRRGIMPTDVLVVQKRGTAPNGQTVIAG